MKRVLSDAETRNLSLAIDVGRPSGASSKVPASPESRARWASHDETMMAEVPVSRTHVARTLPIVTGMVVRVEYFAACDDDRSGCRGASRIAGDDGDADAGR